MAGYQLISLSYSPWSEKARWALDHHHVDYRRIAYQPLLGEPGMRLRLRRLTGTISVPVFFDGKRWITDSWDIARFADTIGKGAPLFPVEHLPSIERFNAVSERGLAAGRGIGLRKVLDDEAALRAMVPPTLGRVLGPAALAIAAYGVRRTLIKYAADHTTDDDHERVLRQALADIRDALQDTEGGGPKTLVGRFTYADIAAAQVLQFVAPKNLGRFKMADASARAYTREHLAREFADVVRWRDELYARYRS